MDKDEVDSLNCPVCFETFEKSGEQCPRLLPCGGIICENCVEELLGEGNSLDCPECGAEHSAEHGLQNFPQFFLVRTGDDSNAAKNISLDEEGCKEHGKQASIYCQDPYCLRTVLSLQKQEKNNDVGEVKEEVKVKKEDETEKSTKTEEPETIEDISQFNFEATPPIKTELSRITRMTPLGANSVIACGEKDNKWMLVRFNLDYEGAVRTVELERRPDGMTGVTLGGSHCIALSYADKMEIEFRYMSRLKKVVLKYSVVPHRPGRLCTWSPTLLLYEDQSAQTREIWWLNCFSSSPESGTNVTHTQQRRISDMCCVEHQGRQLLITTHGGIYAYSTGTNEMVWQVKGKLPGMKEEMDVEAMTTDGLGHIFVCDNSNKCIQMFSTGGRYIGVILKCEQLSVDQPWLVRWCKKLSFVTFAFPKESQFSLCKIKEIEEDTKTAEGHIRKRTQSDAKDEVDKFLEELTQKETAKDMKTLSKDAAEVKVNAKVSKEQRQKDNVHPLFRNTTTKTKDVALNETPKKSRERSQIIRPVNMQLFDGALAWGNVLQPEAERKQVSGATPAESIQLVHPVEQSACLYKFKVLCTFNTHYSCAHQMTLLGCQIFICGRKDKQWCLTRYTAGADLEVTNTQLHTQPSGMVALPRNSSLALSYSGQKKIEFRHPGNIGKPVSNVLLKTSARPGRLFQLNPSTLLYLDFSKSPRKIYQIEQGQLEKNSDLFTSTQHCEIYDLCVVDHEGKQILVTTHSYTGIYAYNVSTKAEEWSVEGKLPGMTENLRANGVATDGRGHLFVCDQSNKCLQIFSVDGVYMGPMLEKEHLGTPQLIYLDVNNSLLFVGSMKEPFFHISVIQLTPVGKIPTEITCEDVSRNQPIEMQPTACNSPATRSTRKVMPGNKAPKAIKCKVIRSSTTGYENISYMSLLGGDRVVVCANDTEEWRMTQYSVTHGGKLRSTVLKETPWGIAEIMLGTKQCLAVSYAGSSKIEFYDIKEPDVILLTYSMLFHKPGLLCTASPTILLYEDKLSAPRTVHWIDCSTSPPKPLEGVNLTSTQQGQVWDMCCVQDGEKTLLVTVRSEGGIYAYDTKTNKLVWSVAETLPGNLYKINPQGITTGWDGRLFVTDSNNTCVQMFSTSGSYIGTILQSTLIKMFHIRWNQDRSSLNVVHIKNGYSEIAVVSILEDKWKTCNRRLPQTKMKTPLKRRLSGTKMKTPNSMAKAAVTKAKRTIMRKDSKSTDESPPWKKKGLAAKGKSSTTVKRKIWRTQFEAHKSTVQTPLKRVAKATGEPPWKTKRLNAIKQKESVSRTRKMCTTQFEVDRSIGAEHSHISYLCVLSNGSVVVCGNEDNQWKLTCYRLGDNTELERVMLNKWPNGLTEVVLEGKACLAVTYWKTREIDFHNSNKLREVVLNFPMAPYRSERICTFALNTLVYLDYGKNLSEVRWFDCSTSPPKPKSSSTGATLVKLHSGVYDICCLQHGSKQLIVTTHGRKGMSAYDTNTTKRQWHMQGKLSGMEKQFSAQGVTTDGRGDIFICDESNKCIQCFSAGGAYIGAATQPGQQTFGTPWRVRWCDYLSTLFVVCIKDKNCHTSKLRLVRNVAANT